MPVTPRARAAAATTVALFALLVAAGTASAEQRNVSMVDDRFAPVSITVKVGDRVRWENDGRKPHTVTSRAGLFDSGLVMSGKTFARTFSRAGTYRYYCFLHPGMNGTVVVKAAVQPRPTRRPPTNPRPTKRPQVQQPDTALTAVADGPGSGGVDGGGGTTTPAVLVLLGAGALGVTLLGQRRMRAAREVRRRG